MITTIAHLVVILAGIWLIGVGIFALSNPEKALNYLGKMASTRFINYFEITLRRIGGLGLVLFAEHSRFPIVFFVAGLFIVVSSGILCFVPRKWHAAYAVFWSKKLNPGLVRICGLISIVAGIVLIWATFPY